jgi:hypothetical protein
MNIDNIIKEIEVISYNFPVFIYTCVGSANYDKNKCIDYENYHQYPPFLQNMKNMIKDLHLVLILIDTYQEDPPYVTIDCNMENNNNVCYETNDRTMRVFVIKKSIHYNVTKNSLPTSYNITDDLTKLNNYCIENDISMLHTNFTGHDIDVLAEYFDTELKNNLDQIIYGFGSRENHGCLYNLLENSAYFPIRIEEGKKRPIIKMFNYYNFIVNNNYDKINKELSLYHQNMHKYAVLHKEIIIEKIINKFKNVYFMYLRNLYNKIHNNSENEGIDYIFLPQIYSSLFNDLDKEKQYGLLYELLSNYLSNELDIIANLKNSKITGEELLLNITNDNNVYNWSNSISKIINDV